jgi:beta-glucosidase
MPPFARTLSTLLLSLAAVSVSGYARAQAPHTLTPAEQAKVASLVKQMTLEQKLDYIGGTGFAVRAVPSLGLPALEMSDGPYGTRSNLNFPSTTYAAGIGLAATWDRDLAARVGGGIGRDARARGVHFMLGPGVNIYRSPRNGRNFEYFGEDPFLAANIAVGYIEGMQQQGVSATVKHFLGNNSEYLRHDSDTIIDERTAREIYLPVFEAAVKQAHVGAIMDSYNLIDGKHATQNGYFNTEIVRKEWGFPGVMMSDWDATYDAVGAANGGLDLEMPNGKFMNQKNLLPAVQAGTVSQATIDEKVSHILSTAESFGWLDAGHSQRDLSISTVDTKNQAVALESARESVVLLKNEGHLLPLDGSKLKTLLIVGPDAYPGAAVGGGSAGVVPFHLVSGVEGLTTALGSSVNVLYERGLPSVKDLARDTAWTTAADGATKGVTVDLFDNKELRGSPAATRVEPHMALEGVSWATLSQDFEAAFALFTAPPKQTSHRFTGYFNAPAASNYVVALEGAGEGNGDRLYIDGKLVFDDWSLVRAFSPHVTLPLAAGPHKVVAEQWQNGPIGGHIRVSVTDQTKIVSPQAVELAKTADAVVIAAGFAAEGEGEGGDRTFALPAGQDELISAIAEANPHTIVSITSGGNVDSTAWIDQVPALLESWYAGQDGGKALAEILLGQVNPSGHLPVTFERRAEDNPTLNNYYPIDGTKKVEYKEGIFVGYRGYEKNGTKPLFPFGYGLSYTTFAFSNLKLTPEFNSSDPHVTVDFDVKNTGSRAGTEVAQVYVGEDHPLVPRPVHELKGFERVQLSAGETKHVRIGLDRRAFAYYDVASKDWKIDAGTFTISVGDSVASLPLTAGVESPKQ